MQDSQTSHSNIHELSLAPPPTIGRPGPEYAAASRRWQGIPGLERSPGGRLWAVWYSGGEDEGPDNFVVVITSGDDGVTWSEPVLVIDPPEKVRAYDPCLWIAPDGRLRVFWAQSHTFWNGRGGVWCVVCDDCESAAPNWSPPQRICNGVMMNKPTVLSTGEWAAPAAVWGTVQPLLPELLDERLSSVVVSTDNGLTWTRRGGADVPHRSFDEHMIVERTDGSLWMLVRTHYGIGQSVSTDGGRTWAPGWPTDIPGPCSRFFIRRLKSGRLLLVNHYKFTGRSHMTARLSTDDGKTWNDGLLLDERSQVSYPDGVQAEDGRIFIIYDRERYGAKEILMAVFREEDVAAGKAVSDDMRLKGLVNRIP